MESKRQRKSSQHFWKVKIADEMGVSVKERELILEYFQHDRQEGINRNDQEQMIPLYGD